MPHNFFNVLIQTLDKKGNLVDPNGHPLPTSVPSLPPPHPIPMYLTLFLPFCLAKLSHGLWNQVSAPCLGLLSLTALCGFIQS